MVQRQHRVGFAPTEVRLQFYNRIAAPARQPFRRADEKGAEAFGQICAAEKLLRIPVLGRRAAGVNLAEVGREFSLLKLAGGNVLVRFDHFPPREETGDRLDRDL